jgi:hypothetical protein
MTEADAEQRDLRRGPSDHLQRDPGLAWGARAWRDDYPVQVKLGDLVRRDLIVAPDENLGPKLTEILNQVVRKGVIVV